MFVQLGYCLLYRLVLSKTAAPYIEFEGREDSFLAFTPMRKAKKDVEKPSPLSDGMKQRILREALHTA